MTGSALDVTAVVVGYNDGESLRDCVGALVADRAADRIIVVDNASSDGTAAILPALEATDPRVSATPNQENIGYAAAVTGVLPSVETTYLAVLNADTVPSPGWLAPQVEYLEAHPEVAATSPTVTLLGTDRLNAAGLDVHVTGLGFNRMLHRPLSAAGAAPHEVPGLQGTAFVIRRAVLESAGGWYSGGFLYHEDVELSWTLRLMGYDISYVPTPPVEHHYELTMSPEKLFLLERNRWEMLLANTRAATRVVLAPLLVWTEVMMWGYCLLRPALLGAKWRSYGSIRSRRDLIAARRRVIAELRRVPDRVVLGKLRWNYTWDQLIFVGRRHAVRGRRGGRAMPVR